METAALLAQAGRLPRRALAKKTILKINILLVIHYLLVTQAVQKWFFSVLNLFPRRARENPVIIKL
jgi:hypothetical protein